MPSAADSILPRQDGRPLPPGGEWRRALAAAVLLHIALALALALMPGEPALAPAPEPEIAVTIVAPPAPPVAAPTPPPPVLSAPPVSAPQRQAPAVPAAPAMVAPTVMLSQKALADPRSRQARASLATLNSSERMVQLCSLEAMEQIHAWKNAFDPELVVPYATRNETVSAATVTAEGAAFRSHDAWYGLSFECRLGGAGRQVVAFRFHVGDPIAPALWPELGLASGPGLD